MKKGVDIHEVLLLAKTMEIKFTISGPPLGGAKSGINFDPSDNRIENLHILYSESEHKSLEFSLLQFVEKLLKTSEIEFKVGKYLLNL